MPTEAEIANIPPFCKIKGTAVKNLKKYIEFRINETYFKEKAREVRLINTDLILPSTWHDAASFIKLQTTVAEELNMSDKEFAIGSARYIVEEDLNGIYKFFMKLGGTGFVLGKLPQMNTAYANFIELQIIENTKGHYVAKQKAPMSISEWNQNGIEGAVRSITKLCSQSVQSISVLEKDDTEHEGYPYQSWTFEVRYH